jgi:hypothetical protein
VPRAHDCITLFLGSRQRYQETFSGSPGTYYFTSGWLECARRRGEKGWTWGGAALPATANLSLTGAYEQWVKKYGEDQAKYLLEEMSRWTSSYTHGSLIDYDFSKPLNLECQVREICGEKGWEFAQLRGSLRLFELLLEGNWPDEDFQTVRPGEKLVPTFDERVVGVVPISGASSPS